MRFTRLFFKGACVGAALLFASLTHAQKLPQLNVQKLKLKNGLVVLALEDHSVPSVSFYTYYKVGSRNEHPGITGLSHLFEHMMFNGSSRFKPKMFDRLIEAGGGYSNAFTTPDSTQYYEEFSSRTLDTVLQLEADRILSLKLDKENLEQERGIVKEERRVNTDNSIPGIMYETLWNNAYVAHPYRWDTIGFMKDINAIRLEDAKAYFRTYYAPNNAIVAVVGDFNTKALFAGMTKYFENIPSQPTPRPVVNAEPPQEGEKRIDLHRAAELPAIIFGYKSNSYKDPDDPALDLLSIVLAGGESARLYQDLVVTKRIATSVDITNDSRLDAGMFTFYVQAAPEKTTAECETAIYEALEKVKAEGVTARELQKAKNSRITALMSKFATNFGRAGLLTDYEVNWGGWKSLYNILPRYERVTLADIQRVAKKYFDARKRTVITLIPEKAQGGN